MSAFIPLAAALLFSAAPAKQPSATSPTPKTVQEQDSLFYKVVVAKGQTLSWIGLRHLGAWTPQIATQVATDNPGLHPNLVKDGDALRLRRSLDRRSLPPTQQISLASRRAVVTRVQGSVDRISPNGTAHPLSANEFLAAGDRIRTGPGSIAELVIDNQSILRLRENSKLSINAIQDSGRLKNREAGTQVGLDLGKVWVKVRKWAGPIVGFEVRLPTAIAGVHGTIFECAARADSSGEVRVHEGVVGVAGVADRAAKSEVKVVHGNRVDVSSQGAVSPPIPFVESADPVASDPSEESTRWLQDDIKQASIRTAVKNANGSFGEYCR